MGDYADAAASELMQTFQSVHDGAETIGIEGAEALVNEQSIDISLIAA